MTEAAYSRHRGVSRVTVLNWKRRGNIVMTAGGQVVVPESDRMLNARMPVWRGGRKSADK